MAKPIELGGRKFRVFSQSTAEHDEFVREMNHRAGLTTPLMYEDEDPDAFARRLVGEVSVARTKFLLLAGLLVPLEVPDLEWSLEIAMQTADFLRRLHEPADKEVMDAVLAAGMHGFFKHGLSSPRISRSASGNAGGQPGQGEAGNSDNGAGLSGLSPEEISRGLALPSPAGPFASS